MIKKASWLKKNIKNKNIKVLDASWYLPNIKRNAYKEYLYSHIKKARFFDIDSIANKRTNLPHMLSPSKEFEIEVSKLGISNKEL